MVIGTILVFAIVVTVYGLVQATVIPSSNADVEAEHSQLTRGQLQDLRNDIQRSANTGQGYSQEFKPGVDYPLRTFFLNPGPAAGTIETRGTDDGSVAITIENAEAIDSETADYLDGDAQTFATGAVVYNPAYNVYRNAPETVVVENSIVYSKYGETTLVDASQRVVEGRDISLTALDGDLSRSQREQFTIDTTALSPGVRTVSVQDDGTPVRIELPTRLSESTLVEDVFFSEIDDDGGPPTDSNSDGKITCADIDSDSDDNDHYITDCSFTSGSDFNTITLIFESGPTYNLQMARVSVGPGGDEPGPYYIKKVEGSLSGLTDTSERQFIYEVRDKYNNPVSGVTVPVTANQGTFESSGSNTVQATTDEDGRITVTYIPDGIPENSTESETVTAGTDLNNDGSTVAREQVESSFTIIDAVQDNDLAASLNPATPINLVEADTSGTIAGGGGGGGSSIDCEDTDSACYVRIELENTGSETWNFDQLRYQFYIAPVSPGVGSREAPPENVTVYETSSCSSESYTFQDPLSVGGAGAFGELDPGNTTTLFLDFEQSSGNFDSIEGDGFIISVKFSLEGNPDETTTLTYFVSPRNGPSADNNPCTGSP